jgi:glucose-6-phosphate 1-dehydrogenase
VLDEFITDMKAANNTKLRQVAERIKANNGMVSYSAAFLNAVNHNPDIFVTSTEVKDAWDAMEPLFRFVLNPAKNNAPGNP